MLCLREKCLLILLWKDDDGSWLWSGAIGNWDGSRVACRFGCAFISARSRWKAVVNIPNFPVNRCSRALFCPMRRSAPPKIEARFGCSATWYARTAVFSLEYTARNKRYTRGTNQPNTNVFARLASSAPNALLSRSVQTNFFVRTYVANMNLINRQEIAGSWDPRFISAITSRGFFTRQHAACGITFVPPTFFALFPLFFPRTGACNNVCESSTVWCSCAGWF